MHGTGPACQNQIRQTIRVPTELKGEARHSRAPVPSPASQRVPDPPLPGAAEITPASKRAPDRQAESGPIQHPSKSKTGAESPETRPLGRVWGISLPDGAQNGG